MNPSPTTTVSTTGVKGVRITALSCRTPGVTADRAQPIVDHITEYILCPGLGAPSSTSFFVVGPDDAVRFNRVTAALSAPDAEPSSGMPGAVSSACPRMSWEPRDILAVTPADYWNVRLPVDRCGNVQMAVLVELAIAS